MEKLKEDFSNFYDLKAIQKELDKVVPPRYAYYDISDIFSEDISFYCSIRADAGKTMNALLLSLVLYKLYKIRTEYLRNDKEQTTEGCVGDLFDKIVDFGYVSDLFQTWNDITYKRIEKAFYLCRREDGEIVEIDEHPVLAVKSNENYKAYKSGYNSARSWFLIWDEFLDSKQPHSTLVQKLFENISTLGRDDPRVHVMALSNGVNKYDAVFDDFCIAKDIEFLDFGDSTRVLTDLGSSYFFKLIPVSAERKEKLEKKKLRFFGISKNKFAHFTGVQAWQGYNYQHLTGDEEVDCKDLYAFIYHRTKWMALYVITLKGDMKPIIHIVNSVPPRKDDRWIYTLNPSKLNEMLFIDCPKFIKDAYNENRMYFSSNNIGLLFDDFLQENGIKKIKDKDRR